MYLLSRHTNTRHSVATNELLNVVLQPKHDTSMVYCVHICQRERGGSGNWLSAPAASYPPLHLLLIPRKCHFLRGFVRAENQISHNNILYSCPHLLCMGTARMYPPCPPSPCPPPLLLLLRRPDAASLSLPVWLRPSSPSSPTHPYSRFRSISFSSRRQFSTSVITDKVLGRHV